MYEDEDRDDLILLEQIRLGKMLSEKSSDEDLNSLSRRFQERLQGKGSRNDLFLLDTHEEGKV